MGKKLLLFICILCSSILYFTAPVEYSAVFSMICFVVFVLSSVIVILNNCKQTLIKFEFFFLISFFLSNISYSVFLYVTDPSFGLFSLGFNESYLNKGLALATTGICCFNYGVFEDRPLFFSKTMLKSVSFNEPHFLLYILYIIFIPQLINIIQSGQYSTSFENSYANTMLMYVLYFSMFVFFYKNRKLSNLSSFIRSLFSITPILIVIYVALFLIIGSRTIPLRVILGMLFFYGLFIATPKKLTILAMFAGGAVFFAVLGAIRGGGEFSASSVGSIFDFGKELIMTNRSEYVLMEYADTHGYTYGKTMILSILCVIPFAMSLFLYITGLREGDVNSANLVTDLYYDNAKYVEGHIGLGTNIIGDIYVCFGFVGVIVLMFLMGRLIRVLYKRICEGDIVSTILYVTMFMDAIYWTRSCYLTPLRTMAWTYLVYWLYNRNNASLFKKVNTTLSLHNA